MTRFIDQYMDEQVPGWPCVSTPRWATEIVSVDSGSERVNQRWSTPLYSFNLPDAVRYHETYEAIKDHWLVMKGPTHTWPFRDPLDFASVQLELCNTVPVLSGTDQTLGTGNGLTTEFQLIKTYTRGSATHVRTIYHPIVSTVTVAIDSVDQVSGYSVDRDTGVITFDTPPAPGEVISAGYLFDVEVRFASDDAFEGIVQNYTVSGFASIELMEVRPCL